ncbi:MAG TPA: type III-B CRISPR module-associated Cmr3 family protein [Candidatus Goldiibacteriota bacterium]|nr:type III-B CRISPR module-associated Cmr3 family protein [Candidatus Goldiibacteriota bacterium]
MKKWYEIIPVDTLFFRGNIPLEAGQKASSVLFPPPVSVFKGAIRTAHLEQNGVKIKDYVEGKADAQVYEKIGKPGSDSPFEITAVLLKKNGVLYAPVPAVWYADDALLSGGSDFIVLSVAQRREKELQKLGAFSAPANPSVVNDAENPAALAGRWVKLEMLSKMRPGEMLKKSDILAASDFYDIEERTGIGLDSSKRVIKGKLYSGMHLRMKEGVSFVLAIDKDGVISDSGFLCIGGENRVCGYKIMQPPQLPEKGSLFMALSPVKADLTVLSCLVASQRLYASAGWDMVKKFHKPTVSWLPAGAVFSEKISESLVPLAQ